MKKKLGIIAALCCMLALCFALVGCGVDKSSYTGEWELAYGSDENLDADSIQLMSSLGSKVTLTLNDDGTGTLNLFDEKIEAKWEASSSSEGKITLNGSEAKMQLENEELTIIDSTDASMTFKRPS